MTQAARPAPRWIAICDSVIHFAGRGFSLLCSLCLVGMLLLTAATIILRPFGVSYYWIFPWTMVLFVWLSFFGFFAAMVFARDIRIDFVALKFGAKGMLVTRILGQAVMLFVLYWLLSELPNIVANARGNIDGVILPTGGELPRRFLSAPLLLSCIGITLALFLDIAKMFYGLPETIGGAMPGHETGRPV